MSHHKKRTVYSSTSTESQEAQNNILKSTLCQSITAVRKVKIPPAKLKGANASNTAKRRVKNPLSKLIKAEKSLEKPEDSQYIPSYSLFLEKMRVPF